MMMLCTSIDKIAINLLSSFKTLVLLIFNGSQNRLNMLNLSFLKVDFTALSAQPGGYFIQTQMNSFTVYVKGCS